ncbi:MAG: 2-oxoisovalerate dehydrogenase [Bacteroidetes bacterium]|nr:2-oxoisovalerate dehydrogenase [Bacteroidota bacterium]
MHLGRILDEKAANYLKQAKGWSYHAPCAGHEGIQLALGLSFRQGQDFLFPYYRDLMTALAAGITPYEIVLNGLSKDGDVAGGGRHMSNHFAKPSIRIQNVSSCTGNHAPHAVGVAKAIKHYQADSISFYSGGESACAEGYFYEAVHGASTNKYPVVFVIQNNLYGISVPLHEAFANLTVSDNFTGMANLKIIKVDGTDALDSWRGMQEAIAYVKSGSGPAMVHAQCVRMGSHSNSDRHELYRSPEELAQAKAMDPVKRLRHLIVDEKIATEEELVTLEKQNRTDMLDAADRAEATADPKPESYAEFLIADPYPAKEDRSAAGEEMTLLQALNSTMKEEFRHNPDTFMWGQDVATKEKGGIFNVSKGMQQEFGYDRVHNSPIAEDYIVGTANGFSRFKDEIRVLVEGAEFADYFWPAMEQCVEMGHEYWRTRGQFSPNVTIRIASGGYITGGLYHSQNIEATLTTLPGMRVVYPAFADDAAGLLRTSVRSRGMSVFLEPKYLYNHAWSKTVVPAGFEVPFGVARTRREGKHLTIVAYGTAVHLALQAAERLAQEGIETEVLDLRSLKPLDEQAIYNAVRKTSRVLVAHEDHVFAGFGGEVVARISAECFNYLDAPVFRVGSKDTPIGFSPILEKAILLNADDIYNRAKALLAF